MEKGLLIELKKARINEPIAISAVLDGKSELSLRSDVVFDSDICFEGYAVLLDDQSISVGGEISFSLKGNCDKCLASATAKVTQKIAEDFYPSVETDKDGYLYQNDILDLKPMLYDCVLNAFPASILCKTDCKGICFVCGEDKNKTNCGHNIEARSKNPFEILKK